MKTLHIPLIENLDATPLSEVGDLLELQGARCSVDCVNWRTQFPYHPITSVSVARSNTYLYINYFVRGNSLVALHTSDNSPVWQDSCVEFFMQAEEGGVYRNFEFNCIGATLAAVRRAREDYDYLTSAQIATIKRHSDVGTKPFKEMQGVFAWELLVAIPFELMGLDGDNLPPSIRANFYKCADGSSLPHYVSWAPIDLPTPDFHCPPFFGRLVF